MSRVRITLACWDYDRTRALREGKVSVEGVDLIYLSLPPEEIFWRMVRHEEFDASEMSFSTYVTLRARGDERFVAIPVFPSRMFRHSAIYVRAASEIQRPEQLKGKRVGVPEYQMTAAVWVRGLLHHEYGVKTSDVEWFTGGLEEPGRQEKVELQLPAEIRVTPIAPTRTLTEMLEVGELDAVVSARAPSALRRGTVTRLFNNYWEEEERYYRRTGIFPIMHVLVLRRDIYEKHRWVAQTLYHAFEEAKRFAMREMEEVAAVKVMHPWIGAEVERLRAMFGEDWWPYGVESNRRTVEMLIQYLQEQGLIARPLGVEQLFAPETLERAKV
jgi:4,5-dihydroxyphthalate decarboxylase